MVERNGKTKPYGMSVHHMLEPQSDDDDGDDEDDGDEEGSSSNSDESREESSSDDSGESYDSTSDEGHPRRSARQPARRSSNKKAPVKMSTSRNNPSISSPAEPIAAPDEPYKSDLSELGEHDEEDPNYISSDFESEPEDTSFDSTRTRAPEPGDRPGIPMGAKTKIQITQPAFDDAMAESLHTNSRAGEKLDADHLSTYSFGKVFASSGLKRWHREGLTHEIDWALIEVSQPLPLPSLTQNKSLTQPRSSIPPASNPPTSSAVAANS